MLNALSSTEKNESDDQSRNAPPTMPSVPAFAWIAWIALRIDVTDVLGNVFSNSWTKNECRLAWCTSPSSASDRNSSGTNERSAKYAIIAARWVPRSRKNFDRTARTGRQYARRHGRGPGDRRPDRDLPAGEGGRGRRRRRRRHGRERRHRPRRRHRRCSTEPARGGG